MSATEGGQRNSVAKIKSMMPPRIHIIIGTDANGHVGSCRTRIVEILGQDMLGYGTRNDDYPYIGPLGAEEENPSGEILREFLEQEDMIALNTWEPEASGITWQGGRNASTRVDYILQTRTDKEKHTRNSRVPEMRRRLRAMAGLEDNDHIPLRLHFRLRPWKEAANPRTDGYDHVSMARSCALWDDKATHFAKSAQ